MRAAVLLLSVLLLAPAALALPPALQKYGQRLPAPEREQLARRHAQLQAMPPAARNALRERAEHWNALPRAERRARRDAWQAWNRLPAAAQAKLRAAAAAYAALPEERQQALTDAFAALDSFERNGWALGPDVGPDWPLLHPLFALVPLPQQEELLAVLLSMDERERQDLGVLAQRTPPGEREELRRVLLTTPAENRGPWLRQMVGP
ncbi:DUF3106 domain-containing protein [Luteimonas sp. A478]